MLVKQLSPALITAADLGHWFYAERSLLPMESGQQRLRTGMDVLPCWAGQH